MSNRARLKSSVHLWSLPLFTSIGALLSVLLVPGHGKTSGTPFVQQTGQPGGVQAENNAHTLEPGRPINRAIVGGQADSYQVVLGAGQYLLVVVEQRGIDVAISLFGPDNQKLAEDDSNGMRSVERIHWVAEAMGAYRLEVRSIKKDAAAGCYEARIELRTATDTDRTRAMAQSTYAAGEQLQKKGTAESLRKAADKYSEAVHHFRGVGDQAGAAKTLSEIGYVYYSLGEKQSALEYYQQALALTRAANDRSLEADTLNRIGLAYRTLGERQKALEYYTQALSLRQFVVQDVEAATLNNIGLLYFLLGERERALEYYTQALPLSRTGNGSGEGYVLNNIGRIYFDLGAMEQALKYYERSLVIRRAVADRRGEAGTLNNMGTAYRSLGKREKARDCHLEALVSIRAAGDKGGEAVTLGYLGRIYGDLGDRQKALQHYNQALAMLQAVGDLGAQAQTLYGMAMIERDLGNLRDASARLETVLKVTESLRAKIDGQDRRVSYFASVQQYYESYVDVLMQLNQDYPKEGFDASALHVSERARARSLLELLSESHADIRQGVDPVLLEKERSIQRSLNAKSERLTRLGNNSEERIITERDINALTDNLQQVRGEITVKSPHYAALTQPRPATLQEIQQQVLGKDDLLLEYSLGEERSYLWAISPGLITSHELPGRSEIQAAATRLYDLLTTNNESKEKATAAAAAALSGQLLAPVAQQLGRKRLLIVAEGILRSVPFGMLPEPVIRLNGQRTQPPGNPGPLIQNHEIVSLPSASTLVVLRKETGTRKSAPKTVAILADPVFTRDDPRVHTVQTEAARQLTSSDPAYSLPADLRRSATESGVASFERLRASRAEAESIFNLAPEGQGLKALDFRASRTTATSEELGDYRIVHFATHTLLDSQHPELTGIVLSLVDERGEQQDGFLRAHEVYNLKLGADLVVLSSCKTALGKEVKGEGLIGLTRGFMYAGAARVVASLWNVPDKPTAELMKRFYRGMLTDGLRPAAALRAAQVEMMKDKRWSAPHYWAAFLLQGEPN